MRQVSRISLTVLGLVLSITPIAYADTLYTSDTSLNDFTTGIQYGTFIAGPFGDIPAPFTPTTASVDAGLRIFGNDATQPVIVQFRNPVSQIVVFANIDHFGSAYDGFQYSISGSNNGTTFTPLFDAVTVNGSGEPFTLGTFTGTAPLSVNNVLSSPLGAGPGGTVGYIANFSFGQSYTFYRFDESTIAFNSGNVEPEFTAVASPVPEPGSILLLGSGLAALAARRWKKLFPKEE